MTWLVVLSAVLIGLALVVRWIEPRLLYSPSHELVQTPASVGLAYRDVRLRAADDVSLRGWFVPVTETDGPVILFLHGNAGNMSHRIEKVALLHGLGASVLIIDYRGYGNSEGEPTEAGLFLDAQAAYSFLVKEQGLAPRRLVVYGESLGTAVAVDLATAHDVGGLILEGAFTSARDVAGDLYPLFPLRLLIGSRFDTLAKIARVKAPLLILHGRNDEFFSTQHSERLLAAAPGPKRLVELRGGHNDAFVVSHDAYVEAIREFLAGK